MGPLTVARHLASSPQPVAGGETLGIFAHSRSHDRAACVPLAPHGAPTAGYEYKSPDSGEIAESG